MSFSKGYVEVSWQSTTDVLGRKFDALADNTRRAIFEAENALRDNKLDDAVQALRDVDFSSEFYARRLMVEALQAQENWCGLIKVVQNPTTVEEYVVLISAYIKINRFDDAESTLNVATEIDAGTRTSLQDRIETKRMMRQP